MRLLSWDIGVHNLSYCLLEKDDSESGFKIIDWDIIDVSAETKKTTDILYNIPIETPGVYQTRNGIMSGKKFVEIVKEYSEI